MTRAAHPSALWLIPVAAAGPNLQQVTITSPVLLSSHNTRSTDGTCASLAVPAQRITTASITDHANDKSGFPTETMSTIASPRPSSSIRSPSSTRTSLEVPTSSSLARSSSKSRRNRDRSALRDYYNLKSPTSAPTSHPAEGLGIDSVKEEEAVETSELDKAGFDAEEYVRKTLEREGLEGVLRVESGLVGRKLAYHSPFYFSYF